MGLPLGIVVTQICDEGVAAHQVMLAFQEANATPYDF
jgi:hypothetical protein